MSILSAFCGNYFTFQPGMTITLYVDGTPHIFRNVQSLSFPDIGDQVYVQMVVPEGKLLFTQWSGLGCGTKATATEFQVKGA